MAQGYSPYYGGPLNRRETPLGLLEYQRMITQGDPNSPLFNAPQFTPRQGGDLRGVQSFGTVQQPEERNVGTVASQIDANLSALEGADKARQLYEDTTFGFNAQQGEWPGTIFQDAGNVLSDIGTGAENIYTAGENFITGSDKPMGLLSGNLMKDMAVQDALDTSGNLLGDIDPRTGFKSSIRDGYNIADIHSANPTTMQFRTGSPPVDTVSNANIYSSAGGGNPAMIPSADVNMAQQPFRPQGIDPMNWDSYDAATGQFPATSSVRPAAQADVSSLFASAAPESQSLTAPLTNWNQLGTPAIQGNIDKLGQLSAAANTGQAATAAQGAETAATAAQGAEAAGSGFGSKVLPGVGAGLSIYDMVEGGVTPGNIMGLGSSLAFLAPAAMGLGPLGWALAGGAALGSLFDWW